MSFDEQIQPVLDLVNEAVTAGADTFETFKEEIQAHITAIDELDDDITAADAAAEQAVADAAAANAASNAANPDAPPLPELAPAELLRPLYTELQVGLDALYDIADDFSSALTSIGTDATEAEDEEDADAVDAELEETRADLEKIDLAVEGFGERVAAFKAAIPRDSDIEAAASEELDKLAQHVKDADAAIHGFEEALGGIDDGLDDALDGDTTNAYEEEDLLLAEVAADAADAALAEGLSADA